MSLLGIDLGTTGVKCAAYSEDGKMIGKTYREYPLYMPEEGVVELDPVIVWERLCENTTELNSFKEVIDDPIEALSISVSGDEALPVDRKGNPLYNTIMAMDKRGDKENKWINSILGAGNIYRITGQPSANLYPLNRLIWFKQNRQDIYEKIYKFLYWEEYIFFKLGVEPVTDYSVICRTLAFCQCLSGLLHYLRNINRIPEVADNILPERFGILAYRYKYKDKIGELVNTLKNSVKIPIVSAGSINSFERLDETIAQEVWGFTIGGAFFEKKFVPDGSYRDNVAAVLKRLGKNI